MRLLSYVKIAILYCVMGPARCIASLLFCGKLSWDFAGIGAASPLTQRWLPHAIDRERLSDFAGFAHRDPRDQGFAPQRAAQSA